MRAERAALAALGAAIALASTALADGGVWTARPPAPGGFEAGLGGRLDGRLFALARAAAAGPSPTALVAFDPGTAEWTARAPLPVRRIGMALAATDGDYVFYAEESQRRAVEDFHPMALGKILPPELIGALKTRRTPEREKIDPEPGPATVAPAA